MQYMEPITHSLSVRCERGLVQVHCQMIITALGGATTFDDRLIKFRKSRLAHQLHISDFHKDYAFPRSLPPFSNKTG